MLADFDPSVAGIAAQPFLLAGTDGARDRRHVPDLLLVSVDGVVTVVDVKAPSRMADPGVRAQFAWTRRVCAGRAATTRNGRQTAAQTTESLGHPHDEAEGRRLRRRLRDGRDLAAGLNGRPARPLAGHGLPRAGLSCTFQMEST